MYGQESRTGRPWSELSRDYNISEPRDIRSRAQTARLSKRADPLSEIISQEGRLAQPDESKGTANSIRRFYLPLRGLSGAGYSGSLTR